MAIMTCRAWRSTSSRGNGGLGFVCVHVPGVETTPPRPQAHRRLVHIFSFNRKPKYFKFYYRLSSHTNYSQSIFSYNSFQQSGKCKNICLNICLNIREDITEIGRYEIYGYRTCRTLAVGSWNSGTMTCNGNKVDVIFAQHCSIVLGLNNHGNNIGIV